MKENLLILICMLFFSAHGQTIVSGKNDSKASSSNDPTKPVFVFTAEQLDNRERFLRYYAMTGYRNDVTTTETPFCIDIDKSTGTVRIYIYNQSIQEMLTQGRYSDDRVLLEVRDPSKYKYLPKYGSKINWMKKNARCFELMLPIGTILPSKFDDILSSVLRVDCGVKKRKVEGIILSRISKLEKPMPNCSSTSSDLTFETLGKKITQITGKPFIDETGYKGKVNLGINKLDLSDLNAINKKLRCYNLLLKVEIREFEFFVITELGPLNYEKY